MGFAYPVMFEAAKAALALISVRNAIVLCKSAQKEVVFIVKLLAAVYVRQIMFASLVMSDFCSINIRQSV
jgi:hypothetical protein